MDKIVNRLFAVTERQRAEDQTKIAISERQKAEQAKQAEEYEAYIAQIGLANAKINGINIADDEVKSYYEEQLPRWV